MYVMKKVTILKNTVTNLYCKWFLCMSVSHYTTNHYTTGFLKASITLTISVYVIDVLLLFSCSFVSNSLQPYGLQHARLPCHSLSPRVYSDSCPLSRWCHQTISFSVTSFSSCPQSFPVPRSFPMSQLFTSCSQSIGASASASVFLMNVQGWFLLGLIGLISLLSKDLSRVFFSTAIQKH